MAQKCDVVVVGGGISGESGRRVVGTAVPGWCLAPGVPALGAGSCRGLLGGGSAGISAYESLSVKCP